MVTPGLREAWTAQRNAAGKTFCVFAVLLHAESQGFAIPCQIPLDVYVSPRFVRPVKCLTGCRVVTGETFATAVVTRVLLRRSRRNFDE
jgi:hypothetical protein